MDSQRTLPTLVGHLEAALSGATFLLTSLRSYNAKAKDAAQRESWRYCATLASDMVALASTLLTAAGDAERAARAIDQNYGTDYKHLPQS